jgi:3-oxoacyl-[acyl-carrier protein] reductase
MSDAPPLIGRVAVVLAASGGLGGASALALARAGATVVGWGRDEGRLAALVERAGPLAGPVHTLAVDLADPDSIADGVARTRELAGDPLILVNITSGPPPSPITGIDRSVWSAHFESMVLSVISTTDHLLPSMRAAGWGRVITSTSSGVVVPIPNLGLSNSLRACLVGWSKTLANEVARDGITVNTVIPGRIATARTRALDEAKAVRDGVDVERVAANSAAAIPVGRYGNTEQFGEVVAFLASAAAGYITGSSIRVDGGMIPSV